MFKIKTLNNISEIGLNVLPKEMYSVSSTEENPDGILLRSASMHDLEMPKSLKGIARAGAGVNNIPVDKCSELGIVVFNTPGANANAVKELVIASLLLSSRKIAQGISWVNSIKGQTGIDKLVEKGKAEFTGPEIAGKKLGVVGLGAIGVMVANAAKSLGMDVTGYDPFISVDAAWGLSRSVNKAASLESLLAESDYITLHVPLNAKTRAMFNDTLFASVKKGAKLLNFSRAEIVDTPALKSALESEIISVYITDFPVDDIMDLPNTILIPHLGASTPESEDNCAEMASKELKDFLEFGIIKNSVNFPDCDMPFVGKTRIAVLHKNLPNVVSALTSVVGKQKVNIDKMMNVSKGSWAYSVLDCDELSDSDLQQSLANDISALDEVVGVRIIQ